MTMGVMSCCTMNVSYNTMYMKVSHECSRTEEEGEGKSMQRVNQERKDHVDRSKSKTRKQAD